MGWLEQQREKQKREAQSRKLASKFARGLDTPSGNPLFDSAYWDEVGSGVMDAINRGGVAGLVGAPVDIVNTVMRPIGLGSDSPVMGSEWIGEQMRLADIVSDKRNPIAETLAGFVDPATIAPFALKAAAVAIPALAAFGATAIGSKANKGAKLSKLAQVIPKQRGIFAGVGAKTANLDNLDIAQKLKQQGVPDELIWKQTGWTFGFPDQKPRFGIPDDAAAIREGVIKQGGWGKYPNSTADEFIAHKDLFNAYPEQSGIAVHQMTGAGGSFEQGAKYDPSTDSLMNEFRRINVGVDLGGNPKSTTLHELQHAIQQREGWARGGSPESARRYAAEEVQAKLSALNREIIDKNPANIAGDRTNEIAQHRQRIQMRDELNAQLEGLKYDQAPAHNAYQRLAGEAEARLTQARMNMTPEQRRAQYPYEPQYFQQATGVPLSDLIDRK